VGEHLEPCPFCGWQPPYDDEDSMLDVMYPTGIYWREEKSFVPGPFTGMLRRKYVRRDERKDADTPCIGMHCTENMGGCGAQIVRDSREEAAAAWNRRPSKPGEVGR
jgi:hypothetical protein